MSKITYPEGTTFWQKIKYKYSGTVLKKHPGYFFAFFLVALSLMPFVGIILENSIMKGRYTNITASDWLGVITVWWTILGITFNSYLQREQKKIAQAENDNSTQALWALWGQHSKAIKPRIEIRYHQPDMVGPPFEIRNVGLGLARKIRIQVRTVDAKKSFFLPGLSTLVPRHEWEGISAGQINNANKWVGILDKIKSEAESKKDIASAIKGEDTTIFIKYEDELGGQYEAEFVFRKEVIGLLQDIRQEAVQLG